MYDVTNWTLFELKQKKEETAIIIIDRQRVENTITCPQNYRADTKRYQAHLQQILKEIDVRYDEMYDVNSVGFEFMENILERQKDKLILDDNGNSIIDKFKTNIAPFDEFLINGGFSYGSLVGIAGETNAGKSDIVYMMIRSALIQHLKVHLHSYELGYDDMFSSFDITQKNKLKIDFTNDDYKNLLSVDMLAKELEDLKRMINLRADDGCNIFILDSLVKTTVNGKMVLDIEVNNVMEALRILAKNRGLIIIIIGLKDKSAKVENRHELYGSVMQGHFYDYLFFIGYEDLHNTATTKREIVMTKNRGQDIKKSIVTDYDAVNHTLIFFKNGEALGETHSKSEKWANALRR